MTSRIIVSSLYQRSDHIKQLVESFRCHSWKSWESSIIQVCLHQIRYSSVASPVQQPFWTHSLRSRLSLRRRRRRIINVEAVTSRLNDFCPFFYNKIKNQTTVAKFTWRQLHVKITCGRGDHLLVKLACEASSSSAGRAGLMSQLVKLAASCKHSQSWLDELARQASSSSQLHRVNSTYQIFKVLKLFHFATDRN